MRPWCTTSWYHTQMFIFAPPVKWALSQPVHEALCLVLVKECLLYSKLDDYCISVPPTALYPLQNELYVAYEHATAKTVQNFAVAVNPIWYSEFILIVWSEGVCGMGSYQNKTSVAIYLQITEFVSTYNLYTNPLPRGISSSLVSRRLSTPRFWSLTVCNN